MGVILSAVEYVFEVVRDCIPYLVSLLEVVVEPKVIQHVQENEDILTYANDQDRATKLVAINKEQRVLEEQRIILENGLDDDDLALVNSINF